MPPRSSAPPSKSAKPASKAAAKPASKAAPAAKPPSTKPASSKPASTKATSGPNGPIKPMSKRGRGTATPAPAAVPVVTEATIQEDGDIKMNEPEAEVVSKVNGATKRGRVGDLVQQAKKPRRSSLARGTPLKLDIPQPPPPSKPHTALFIFGTGDMGQLGMGPDELDDIKRPKLHSWFEEQIEDGKLSRDGQSGSGGLEAVAAGGMHTLAIDEAGKIRSWGINDNACLGRITSGVEDPENPGKVIENENLETTPFVVESLAKEGFRAVSVAAGDSVSVAVSDKGEIRAWGSFRGNEGVLGFDGVPGHSPFQFTPIALTAFQKAKVQIVQVACGENHVLALTTTGHVYVWGSGQQNQLGRRIMARRQLNGLEPERLGLRNIVHVAAGVYHSFAVDANGIVWAWGLNTFHQTGLTSDRGGDEEMVIVPAQVDALSPDQHNGAKVVQISGGEHHSLFLFDNGEVWGCGRSDSYQLGLGEAHPAFEGIKERREEVRQARLAKVEKEKKSLAALLAKGDVDEEEKKLAENAVTAAEIDVNTPQDDYVPEPVRIAFPPVPESYEVVPEMPSYADSKPETNPIAQISAGTRHNIAVSRSGHVYSWGLGQSYQLGLGDDEEAEVPTLVRSKSLKPYRAIAASAGGQHCCLLAKLKE